jgi:phosphate transport system permease protein
VTTALLFLAILLVDVVLKGHTAFFQTVIRFEVFFDRALLDPEGENDPEALIWADHAALWRRPLLEEQPVEGRQERRELFRLVSSGAAYELQEMIGRNPDLLGTRQIVWLPASAAVDMVVKGHISRDLPESERPVSDRQLRWLEDLERQGRVKTRFNVWFFSSGDSREPEIAGILAAVVGSLYTMAITLLLSFPLGVATAVFLEEFAPRNNRWIDLIEVNINNLAAVPSIVFGLLGLAVFLNFFGLPRSAPLVGGMVLSLMTLPTVIIAGRSAIKTVPPSVREAAFGLGATPMQVTQHHVLPAAMPGMLTGTIIGMARALGETAPLLMIGMVAFIVDVPHTPLDPATVLPVQVFLWADSPERAFVEKTSAAILVLLAFLISMNALAVYLRQRWEQRW